ncbi:PTS sugar transporter subunit IIA [Salisediminibacterium beveridgei]|uniref:Ascorbate-specific PTS system EIIA component n=1 Tax=Salisediminibacterium beveridgei TaxID=632773 RepID=A0A1D7QZQ6_9BACI|nr:PTS sugar transporter subunit IIA [Salisediminibacterium beveridgei]AOM84487.1 PTS system, IIA component [Salisediminibacterium beveridgei]
MSTILQHVNEDLMMVHAKASNRNQAIEFAGDLLVKNHLATEAYISAMIQNVEENGTYIVIAPGIALPHARPEAGVLDMGISIVTLEEPIPFGHEKNDPVDIVIGLCAVDHDKHLHLLSSIISFLSDDIIKQELSEATSKQEVIQLIKRSGM